MSEGFPAFGTAQPAPGEASSGFRPFRPEASGSPAGEVRPGDPSVHAFSIMGPMLMGVLWRETFTPIGGAVLDLPAIARQHAEPVLDGLLVAETRT